MVLSLLGRGDALFGKGKGGGGAVVSGKGSKAGASAASKIDPEALQAAAGQVSLPVDVFQACASCLVLARFCVCACVCTCVRACVCLLLPLDEHRSQPLQSRVRWCPALAWIPHVRLGKKSPAHGKASLVVPAEGGEGTRAGRVCVFMHL